MKQPIDFVVDFDGTVVEEKYDINDSKLHGDELPFCVSTLRSLQENGHRIVLWTMRDGRHLVTATMWFANRNINLLGANKHPEQWGDSPKTMGHRYIDDRALGMPLNEKNQVSWRVVALMLHNEEYITKKQYNKILTQRFSYEFQS